MNGMEGEVLGVGCWVLGVWVIALIVTLILCLYLTLTLHTIPAQLRWYLCKIYSLAG